MISDPVRCFLCAVAVYSPFGIDRCVEFISSNHARTFVLSTPHLLFAPFTVCLSGGNVDVCVISKASGVRMLRNYQTPNERLYRAPLKGYQFPRGTTGELHTVTLVLSVSLSVGVWVHRGEGEGVPCSQCLISLSHDCVAQASFPRPVLYSKNVSLSWTLPPLHPSL